MVGMSAALLVWAARRSAIPYRVGMTLATILMIGSLWPVVMPFLIDRYRDSIAPQLVRFDSRYVVRSRAQRQRRGGGGLAGGVADRRPRAAESTLADERWPGIWFPNPISDWVAFSELDADVFVEGTTPMPITVSIRLRGAAVDHVYRTFQCDPGPCRLRYRLDGLFDRRCCSRDDGGRPFRAISSRSYVLPRADRTSRVDCSERNRVTACDSTRWCFGACCCVRLRARTSTTTSTKARPRWKTTSSPGIATSTSTRSFRNREVRTAAFVAAYLKTLGIDVTTGVAHTGVVGTTARRQTRQGGRAARRHGCVAGSGSNRPAVCVYRDDASISARTSA